MNPAPVTTVGGSTADTLWTFASPNCNKPNSLSDSGLPFTVKVTVTGTADTRFGIALLGDVKKDKRVWNDKFVQKKR